MKTLPSENTFYSIAGVSRSMHLRAMNLHPLMKSIRGLRVSLCLVLFRMRPRPVYVDSTEDVNIDPLALERRVTVAPSDVAHIHRDPCDMERSWKAPKARLAVIGDTLPVWGRNIGPGLGSMVCPFYSTIRESRSFIGMERSGPSF